MSNPVHPGREAFLRFLIERRDDRGVMADLRCSLIGARETRAWPHLALFCDLTNPQSRTVFSAVAAAGSITPAAMVDSGDDIGTTMRKIAIEHQGEKGLNSFRLRFQRLLSCDTREELVEQLHSIFQAAKARGLTINTAKLFDDLWFWGEKVKIRWAQAFWGGEKP